MKTRSSFVSNSSSASFIIKKEYLTPEQIKKIYHHIEECVKYLTQTEKDYLCTNSVDIYDRWDIRETEEDIYGFTIIDNFATEAMELFLNRIGVPADKIKIESDNY